MDLEITRTLPMIPHGVFVQWVVKDAVESGDYVFSVSRSGGPVGPWDELVSGATNIFNFHDRLPTPPRPGVTDPSQLSLSRGIYYRVQCRTPSGSIVEAISAVEPKLDGRQRMLKRKMLRDETVMLQRLNGTEIAVLKRKHWGTRCPKCYDKYTKESMRANCSNCFGTTFVGGYYDPVVTWAKRGTTPNQTALTPQGQTDLASTHGMILDAPGLEKDDILVWLVDNHRFRVERVLPTELRTVTVHQRLELVELPRSDIVYRVKVDPTRIPRLF